jgi:hypothetical protein
MLLHVLDGEDASLVKSIDWLNGEPVDTFLNRVMRATLDAIAAEQETDDTSQWASAMPQQHYTRLNVTFLECEVARAGAGEEAGCADELPGNVRTLDYMNRGTYNHIVEFRPTDVADDGSGQAPDSTSGPLPATGAGAVLAGTMLLAGGMALRSSRSRRWVLLATVSAGAVALVTATSFGGETLIEEREGFVVEAESIISPGQSGFIDQLGQQSPHYEDQHELYANWIYKPMPLLEADVLELGNGEVTTLTYPG